MAESTVEIECAGVAATVWMNRPAVHNAFNEALIEELTSAFRMLSEDARVRVLILAGRGRNFSAGADIESMRRQGQASYEENLESARRLAALFGSIAHCAKPTVARVQGAVMGGGLGLVAACDVAIAASDAVFAASEVKLGLIPATIAPYVVRAVGQRHARRYFLTGERFGADEAVRVGLVHEKVDPDQLDTRIAGVVEALAAGAPLAQKAAKEVVEAVIDRPITEDLVEDTAQRIATIRSQPEACEGLSAFLEKRSAAWVKSQ